MIDELRAMRAVLDGTSTVRTWIGDASGRQVPFRVVWSGAGGRDPDDGVGGTGARSGRVGVTCTAHDAETALMLAADTIDRLTPGRFPATLPGVTGRHVQIDFIEARDVQIDRTTTFPGVEHPAFAVVLFAVHSQPV